MPPDAPAESLESTAAALLIHRVGLDPGQAAAVVLVLVPWLARRLKRLS
jgi:hypothetical protein